MSSIVRLRWSGPMTTACVGDVTGAAELAVVETGVRSAIALVDEVLVPGGPSSVCPGDAASLASADRDRILVQVYLDVYGPVVDTTVTCRECGEKFDLDFRLDELAAHCEPVEPVEAPPWSISGVQFRPLTGVDELAVLGDADIAASLLRRVAVAPEADVDVAGARDDVAAALARLTPPISAPIGATCPECGVQHELEFDLQRYLLTRLLGERAQLLHSVHLIATTYHWSRAEIVALGRRERHHYSTAIGSTARAR